MQQPYNFNQYPSYSPYMQNSMYMDRINNLQQYQQALQPQPQRGVLGGKVVDSIEVVKATDIPMDGNFYYFPKADGTEVYAKRWLPTGNTETVVFCAKMPLETQGDVSAVNSPPKAEFELVGEIRASQSEIMQKLDEILGKFDVKSTRQARAKKEETEE